MIIDQLIILLGATAAFFNSNILPIAILVFLFIFYRQTNHRGFLYIAIGQFMRVIWSLISYFASNFIFPQLFRNMSISMVHLITAFQGIIALIVIGFYSIFLLIGLSSLAKDLRMSRYRTPPEPRLN
jgi:hypothetical protein